jgi:hypothetical protein
VWTLGHAVREIERSHHQVTIEETATTGAAVIFWTITILSLILIFPNVIHRRDFGALFLLPVPLYFSLFGLYAAVRSSFVADRAHGILIVKRQIGPWSFQKMYKSETIDLIYVRHTIKGSGLAVHFKSGKNKDLTMSLDSQADIESAAAALNHFL